MKFINIFTDAAVFIAVTNLLNNIVNVYYSVRLRSMQASTEMIEELKEEVDDLRELNDSLKEDKRKWKEQYKGLLSKFQQYKVDHITETGNTS